MVHENANCSSFLAARLVVTPAPATLRITDGRQGKADAPVIRIMDFQLTAEEARIAPDVVTSMYLLLISLLC